MKKGHTNNPNGRPRGVPNKTTKTAREWLSALIDQHRELIESDLLSLEPKDRVAAITKLMEFVVPKASSNMNISFERLDEAELNQVVEELSNNLKE